MTRDRVFALGDEPIDAEERAKVAHFSGTASASCRCGFRVTVNGRQENVRRVMRVFDAHVCQGVGYSEKRST